MATSAPSAASPNAMALPMPRPPPVTSATRPSSVIAEDSSCQPSVQTEAIKPGVDPSLAFSTYAAAPSCVARSATSWRRPNAETTTTAVSGATRRMSGSASHPSIPGMRMSSRTASGCNRCASRTASAPSRASPTTSKRPSRSNNVRARKTMSGSSSTSTTLALAPSPSPSVAIDANATPRYLRVQLCGQIGQPAERLLDEIALRERERSELERPHEEVDLALPAQGPHLTLAAPPGHGPEELEGRSLDRRSRLAVTDHPLAVARLHEQCGQATGVDAGRQTHRRREVEPDEHTGGVAPTWTRERTPDVVLVGGEVEDPLLVGAARKV